MQAAACATVIFNVIHALFISRIHDGIPGFRARCLPGKLSVERRTIGSMHLRMQGSACRGPPRNKPGLRLALRYYAQSECIWCILHHHAAMLVPPALANRAIWGSMAVAAHRAAGCGPDGVPGRSKSHFAHLEQDHFLYWKEALQARPSVKPCAKTGAVCPACMSSQRITCETAAKSQYLDAKASITPESLNRGIPVVRTGEPIL